MNRNFRFTAKWTYIATGGIVRTMIWGDLEIKEIGKF